MGSGFGIMLSYISVTLVISRTHFSLTPPGATIPSGDFFVKFYLKVIVLVFFNVILVCWFPAG